MEIMSAAVSANGSSSKGIRIRFIDPNIPSSTIKLYIGEPSYVFRVPGSCTTCSGRMLDQF